MYQFLSTKYNTTKMSSCCVCVQDFTKQPNRKQACCPYCDIKICVTCVQTYLQGTHEDAHCMNCRRGWTREVLDAICLTTWINGAYKKHRENQLVDRERSRLPVAQVIVERRKKANELEPGRLEILEQMTYLEKQLSMYRQNYYELVRRMSVLTRGEDPDTARGGEANTPQEERRVFVMPCPATSCRGFLSQAYKCGVCDTYVCPECREIKNGKDDANHVCDASTVATVRALKKDTRPCPDCGTCIFKIEGCNQMFCTNCNTPFDWVSGKKITNGVIHNPHYFEYLRATNGGIMPRNPGDIPCGTNLPGAWSFEREVIRRYPHLAATTTDWLYKALQTIAHIQHAEIPNLANHAEDMDNTEYNVRYITKDINEARWKQLLQMREKRRLKRDEVRMRYEAFVGACVDIFGRLMEIARANPEATTGTPGSRREVITDTKTQRENIAEAVRQAKEQLMALRLIFNTGMMEISKRYKCQVLQLTEVGLKRETRKYEAGKAKPRRVKKTDGDTVGDSDTVAEVDELGEDTSDDEVPPSQPKNILVRS